MSEQKKNPLRCRHSWILGAGYLTWTMLIGCTWLLLFGNPQWSKHIYFFRWQVWPGKEPQVPTDYTGTWHSWSRDGRDLYIESWKQGAMIACSVVTWNREGSKTSRTDYLIITSLDGASLAWETHGKEIMWDNAQKFYESHWVKGKRDGLERYWDIYGFLEKEGMWRKGQRHGAFIHYTPEGEVEKIHWYLDDEKVTEDAFKTYLREHRDKTAVMIQYHIPQS